MAQWRKTPSDSNAVLEVGRLDHGDYAIRNSLFPARTVIATPVEMRAFIQAVKNGTFDRLMEGPK